MDATLEPRLVIQGMAGIPYVQGDFLVAAYQRGYRWGREEVRALLEDIAANERDAEAEDRKVPDYFLQPVVAIRRGHDPAVNSWELVDGQQRLTTLYLVVKYIQRHHLPSARLSYRLSYETREGSAAFLDSLDPGLADDNIDYRHIATAYAEVEQWFEEQGNAGLAATSMHTALAKWVYVIWYEAPINTSPTDLFIRLNRDRIPLTESELVKALVLSSSGVERRDEVAAQWDRFELDLRDRPLWAFLTGTDSEPATYIDFLLKTMPPPLGIDFQPDESRHWLFGRARDHIHARGVEGFWSAVVAHHGLLTGWFKDRDLYHRIGYLVAIGDSITDLVILSRGLTHSAFREALKERTRQRLGLTSDDVSLLRYGKSARRDRDCVRVLLLMNVETVLASEDPANRFNFYAYAAARWSLEHIHAQRSESPDDEKGRRAWLEMHKGKIAGQPWPSESRHVVDQLLVDLATHLARPITQVDGPGFEHLRDRVITLFDAPDAASDDDTHSLGNLALLQRDINSMLNNAVFALKRDRLVKLDKQGVYLLPCTRNVFLKYYTAGTEHASLWGPGDRRPYYEEMILRIGPFLTDSPPAVAGNAVGATVADSEGVSA